MSLVKGFLLVALPMAATAGLAQYGPGQTEFPGRGKLRLQNGLYRSLALVDSSVINYLDGVFEAMPLYKGLQLGCPDSDGEALRYAEEKFHARGGFYRYGPNDCSTFVCDFLSQFSTTIPRRFTTGTLFGSGFMNSRGFVQVFDLSRGLQEYDVLVYRYFDADFQAMGGHCGIVVWKDGQLCIEHNSSSNKGLVCTPIDDFYRRVGRSRDLMGPHVFRWAGQ